MTSIEFSNGTAALIPSSWDELTPSQVQWMFRLWERCGKGSISRLEFNIRVLYHLLGVKPSHRRPVGSKRSSLAENVYRLCENCLGFLFLEDGGTLSYASVVNPMPVIKRPFRRSLIGPADMLSDLSFGEFRHAARALQDFFSTMEESSLDECIAFLYRHRTRRANRCGRRVKLIGNDSIDAAIRCVKGLEGWRKSLIMTWFATCIKHLQTETIVVDGEEIKLSALFVQDSGTKGSVSFGWNDIMIQIARDNILGPMDRVDEEPLMSILLIMWNSYKQNKSNEKTK